MCHPIDGPSPSTKNQNIISPFPLLHRRLTKKKKMLQAHGSQIDKSQLYHFFLSFVAFFHFVCFLRKDKRDKNQLS